MLKRQSRLVQFLTTLIEGRFALSALFLILNQGIVSGFGFAFWILAARSYSSVEIGRATAELGVCLMLGTISTLGLPAALTRELPNSRAPGALTWRVLGVTAICATGIGAVGVVLISRLLTTFTYLQEDSAHIALLVVFVVSYALLLPLEQTLVAARSAGKTTIMLSIFAISRLIGPVVGIGAGSSAIIGAWSVSLLIAIVFSLSVLLPKAISNLTPLRGGALPAIAPLFRFAAGNHFATLVALGGSALIPATISIGLLGESGAQAAGTFYVCFQVASLLYVVPTAISVVQFAEGARIGSDTRSDERRAFQLAFSVTVPGILFISALAHPIVALFGPTYVEAGVWPLRVLALSAIAVVPATMLATRFRLAGSMRPVIAAASLASMISLLGTLLLVSPLGPLGAAVAFLAGQVACALLLARLLWRDDARKVMR